jgi:hypothetical protein
VSSFPSLSLLRISTPILSIPIPTFGFYSGGGLSLGFIMGSGIPFTSTIPMSGMVSPNASSPFGWNIPSGFGVVPSQARGNNTSRGFKFP